MRDGRRDVALRVIASTVMVVVGGGRFPSVRNDITTPLVYPTPHGLTLFLFF